MIEILMILFGCGAVAAIVGGFIAVIFSVIFCFMPYVCSLGAIGLAYLAFPVLQKWIPGHPYLCFFIELAVVEVVTYKLTKYEALSSPIIVFSCTFCAAILVALIFEGFSLKSTFFCVFLTIAYEIVTIYCIKYNLSIHGVELIKPRNWVLRIIAAILYVATIDTMVSFPFGFIWEPYFTQNGVDVPPIFHMIDIGAQIIACVAIGILFLYHDMKQAHKVKRNSNTFIQGGQQ